MARNGKAPVLVIVQLSGGNDFMNTLVPYTNGVYYDSRPTLSVAPEQVLGDDTAEKTDVVKLGDLSFFVIKRGDRVGVRVRDAQSPVRTKFKGLDYFPASPAWKVTGTFVPYEAPKKVQIPTVLGTTETMEAPGVVKLSIEGREVTLEPVVVTLF